MKLAEAELFKLWREYDETKSQELRNVLLEHYLPLVKYVAERLHARMPREVELDDLMSAGVFGMMDAIDNFDPDRGVKFETYCNPRIRGAILDELRSLDWIPRLVRSRAHKLDDAYRRFEVKHGRVPTDSELARDLDMSEDELGNLMRSASAASVISLNRNYCESDGSRVVQEIDVLKDGRIEDPTTNLQKQDLRELITRGLNQKERLIIILYYYEEMTMKEIGMTLNLSESRVSQMHASILLRLQNQLVQRRHDFVY